MSAGPAGTTSPTREQDDNVDLAGQLSDVSLSTMASEAPGYTSQSSGHLADISNAASDTPGFSDDPDTTPRPPAIYHGAPLGTQRGVLLGRGARLVGRNQSPFVPVRQARGYNQHGVLPLSMSERSGSTRASSTSVESARATLLGRGARLDDTYDYAGHAQTPAIATQQTYGTPLGHRRGARLELDTERIGNSQILHAPVNSPCPSQVLRHRNRRLGIAQYPGSPTHARDFSIVVNQPFRNVRDVQTPATPFGQVVGASLDIQRGGSAQTVIGPTHRRRQMTMDEISREIQSFRDTMSTDQRNLDLDNSIITSSSNSSEAPKGMTFEEAQAFFKRNFCVFVANLPDDLTDVGLEAALIRAFKDFGVVYVNVKRGLSGKAMPYAFLQYTNQDDADLAFAEGKKIRIGGRVCRTERAKMNRFFVVFRNDGANCGVEEVRSLMEPYGEIASVTEATPKICKDLRIRQGISVDFECFVGDDDDEVLNSKHGRYRFELYKAERHLDQEEIDRQYIEEYGRTKRSIFVGRLPKDVTEEELRKFFDRFGKIVEVKILQKDGPWDYGFLEFSSEIVQQKALLGKHHDNMLRPGHRIVIDQKNADGKASAAPRRVPAPVGWKGRAPSNKSSTGGLSTKNSFGSSKSGKRSAPVSNKTKSSFTPQKGLNKLLSPYQPLETTLEGSEEELESMIAASKTIKGKGKSIVGERAKITTSTDAQGKSVIKIFGVEYELVPVKQETEEQRKPASQSGVSAVNDTTATTERAHTGRYDMTFEQSPREFVERPNAFLETQVGRDRSNLNQSILNRPVHERVALLQAVQPFEVQRYRAPIGHERQALSATSVSGNVSPEAVLSPLLRNSVADVNIPYQHRPTHPAPVSVNPRYREYSEYTEPQYSRGQQFSGGQNFSGSRQFGSGQHLGGGQNFSGSRQFGGGQQFVGQQYGGQHFGGQHFSGGQNYGSQQQYGGAHHFGAPQRYVPAPQFGATVPGHAVAPLATPVRRHASPCLRIESPQEYGPWASDDWVPHSPFWSGHQGPV
ncbi:hypothetical protein B0T14DRAFT_598925 [Immersiella caudata]|uniref:RRM domain-containing protein n=1 Tax=Immersiella caudata TaxID=314043 RepID=A0AA40CDQ5_9PEZI|nr:hypothetical protein B0T14DRAFT_598925 [Immersiella caudata]